VTEKLNTQRFVPATDLAPRPGDFPLGSSKSRAAARALLEKRSRPKRPPDWILDLSSESIERCREIYAKLATRPRDPIPDGVPYIQIRFPNGFTPGDQPMPAADG
jgi:hypothetical protein